MNILGLSAFYHDAACCLLQDGKLVAAASEERFTSVKYDSRLPVQAFRFCLREGRITLVDLDCVAYYESPVKKLARQLWSGAPESGARDLPWLDSGQAERAIRRQLGFDGPILCFDHHRSHAASAFFYSGFDDAAVLTVDGVGEWATTTYARGRGDALDVFEEVRFPHSLGLLYATLTSYLGFRVNDGEYKVMGLAPYGEPNYADQVRTLVRSGPRGQFKLEMQYFDFVHGRTMFSDRLSELFGRPPRERGKKITSFHCDVAKSLQVVLEEILLEKVRYLAGEAASPNLCMAGGVALNCVANGRIVREGPFERLFVQPAAGDAGGSLGAAALAHRQLSDRRPTQTALHDVFLGPRWSSRKVASILTGTGLDAQDFRDREAELLDAVVDRLEQNKVIGWFQGAMEFGPRALGARSILASPLDVGMRDRVNRMIKKRESFRPFAPSVLAEHAAGHFDLDHPSPFMLETCRVTSNLELPAITHVDGSARPQTVDAKQNRRFAALLEAFYRRTGCPMLLNTSFNVRAEPIVCSPVDALFCMGRAGLDCLVLEDFLIDREVLPDNWDELFAAWRRDRSQAFSRTKNPLQENLYTFV